MGNGPEEREHQTKVTRGTGDFSGRREFLKAESLVAGSGWGTILIAFFCAKCFIITKF